MNIFYLHRDPKQAAEIMINKHVVKMIVESAQLLSTAHRVLDGYEEIHLSKNNRRLKRWMHPDPKFNEVLYKSSFVNHPSGIWVRAAKDNYQWLYDHFVALGQEYKKRYNKDHLTIVKLSNILSNAPQNIPVVEFTEPTPAMPIEYKVENNSLQSYTNYYVAEKLKLGTDTDRSRYLDFIKSYSEVSL